MRELLLLSLFFLFASSQSPQQRQKVILEDFYNHLNGINWYNSTGWITNENHCTWHGISCDPVFGTVIKVELQLNNLVGQLPETFSELSSLIVFNVTSNVISGSIPRAFCVWNALLLVDLSSNHFNGTIPDCWTEDSPLLAFNLRYNRIEGNIPHAIGLLKELIYFDVAENGMDGEIPLEMCLLKNLVYFIAVDNLFYGEIPPCLGDIIGLTTLYLDINYFSGTIPVKILQHKHLDAFGVSNNFLEGVLEDNFSPDQNMTILFLYNNLLEGTLPKTIHNLYLMRELRLESNLFTGEIPSTWTEFKDIRSIIISDNNLTGIVPGPFPSVRVFIASRNSLTGTVDFLPNMTNLQWVDLSYNKFYGVVPVHLIYDSTTLARIQLNNNNFSGPLFDFQAWNLAPVNYIDISHNQFTGQMGISYLPQLNVMKVNNNRLRGFLNAIFSKLLTEIDMSYNEFIGPVPQFAGTIERLESFKLDHNSFSGGIPEGLSKLKYLKTFSASHNQLDSNNLTILTQIPSMQFLDLSHNIIKAALPPNLGEMKNLKSLNLSNNLIHGEIPPSLFSIASLDTIRLANNRLTGSFQRLAGSAIDIDLSDNQLEGDISWFSSMTAIQLFNVRNNMFFGTVDDVSSHKQAVKIDLSANRLSGPFPAFSLLPKLIYLNGSFNSFVGKVPRFEGAQNLQVLDLSFNYLNDSSSVNYLTSLDTCSLFGNKFECPITDQSRNLCNAGCQTTSGGSATLRLRVEEDFALFKKDLFISQVSTAGNFSSSRLTILRLSSGSVIADMEISPPSSDQINEGSAERIRMRLIDLATNGEDNYKYVGLKVLEAGLIPADESSQGLSKGAIAGIVVAISAIFLILIGIMIFLIIRGKRKTITHNQFAMIDVSTINLGAAKKSIIEYSALSEMVQIGSGAFGIVYKARFRGLEVAVKQIRAEYVTEKQLRDFLMEVAVLQGLRSHPNVVLFIGVTFPPDPLSLITEFCDGGGLYEYLRSHQLSSEEKKKIILGVARGMFHLHSEKVVHRDLACRNILLTRHLEPKVADFGLSREQSAEEDVSTTTSVVGPLKWMAPEAIQSRQYSAKSDVFSFGVVVWEVISVEDPYALLSPMEAAFLVVNDEKRLEIPIGTDSDLVQLMQNCWMSNPGDRPDMEEICRFLEGEREVIKLNVGSDKPNNYSSMLPEDGVTPNNGPIHYRAFPEPMNNKDTAPNARGSVIHYNETTHQRELNNGNNANQSESAPNTHYHSYEN